LTAIRDIVLVLGYLMISFAAGERFPVSPSIFGKMTTGLLIVCVIGTLTGHFGLSQRDWYALLYLTGLVLVVSGIHYLHKALVYLSQHVPELFS
jgi:phosphatidylglycerophosphate synthase